MAEGSKVRTVAELMSAPPVTALSSETVAVVATRMEERKVGSVVVVDLAWREHYAHFPDVKRARAVQINAQMQRAAAAVAGSGSHGI